MWFSDMGTSRLSVVQNIKVSFIPLMPYWITIIIGVLKKLKYKKINYKLFTFIFIIMIIYYFYLSNKIQVSLFNNY